MKQWIGFAALTATMAVALPVKAGLRDIHADKLPQSADVQKAYTDVQGIEGMVREWSPRWKFMTPKESVIQVLTGSLETLQHSLESSPNNEELLLLTGVVAHYAYNVGVENDYQVAVDCFKKAHKLAPDDYRAQWFLSFHECEADQIVEGMTGLLSIEQAKSWNELPVSFWDDYIYCALTANMPAHALRAGDYLKKLNAPPSSERDSLLGIASNRFKDFDGETTTSARDVWEAHEKSTGVVFTSTLCGISFAAGANWRVEIPDMKNNVCLAQFGIGPFPGKAGDITPNILVVARPAKPGETLQDFAKVFVRPAISKSIAPADCPSTNCLAYEQTDPGGYKSQGDALGLVTIFERAAPEFPGLLFEVPTSPPESKSGQASYFRVVPSFRRLSGTLYYLVLLDTASSVRNQAESDYDNFLKSTRVE
jgi:hypothetical protein